MGSPTTFLGRQITQKLIGTFTVSGYDAATTYSLQIPDTSGPAVSAIAAGSVNATATALVNAWNAAIAPFSRVTASSTGSSGVITLTADNAGEPFTAVASVSGGTGAFSSSSLSVTQVNKSPNDFSDIVNWSLGAVPTTGDTVGFDNVSVDCKWDLNATTNVASAINISGTYQASIGLPKINTNGNYPEYRPRYLTLQASTVNIGEIDGSGPNLFMHNNGATQCTWNIFNTGSNPESGIPCVLLLGSSASNAIAVYNGTVGVAFFVNETANLSGGIFISGGSLITGVGCTLSGVTQSGGSLDTSSALGTVTQDGGSHVHRAGNITALNVESGTFEIRSPSALSLTNSTLGTGATLDLTNCTGVVTLGNPITAYPGATILDPNNRLASFAVLCPGGPGSVNILRAPVSATVTFT